MFFRPAHSEEGFTLIEVTLAVSLVAVIAGMVFGSLYLSASAIDRTRAETAEQQILRSTLRIMAEELSTSIKSQQSPWMGINGQRDGQPADILAFLSIGQFHGADSSAESETVKIVYTREEDRLLRVVRRNLYGVTDESIDHMDLLVKVKGFNVRYYDRTSNVWSDEWDGRSRSGLPSALLIELILAQEQQDAEPRTIRQWVSLGVLS